MHKLTQILQGALSCKLSTLRALCTEDRFCIKGGTKEKWKTLEFLLFIFLGFVSSWDGRPLCGISQ